MGQTDKNKVSSVRKVEIITMCKQIQHFTEDRKLSRNKKLYKRSDFEKILREYLRQAKSKLEHEYTSTREAMKLVAENKTKEFMQTMDRGLDREERDYLSSLIVSGMYQSFVMDMELEKLKEKVKVKNFAELTKPR